MVLLMNPDKILAVIFESKSSKGVPTPINLSCPQKSLELTTPFGRLRMS